MVSTGLLFTAVITSEAVSVAFENAVAPPLVVVFVVPPLVPEV